MKRKSGDVVSMGDNVIDAINLIYMEPVQAMRKEVSEIKSAKRNKPSEGAVDGTTKEGKHWTTEAWLNEIKAKEDEVEKKAEEEATNKIKKVERREQREREKDQRAREKAEKERVAAEERAGKMLVMVSQMTQVLGENWKATDTSYAANLRLVPLKRKDLLALEAYLSEKGVPKKFNDVTLHKAKAVVKHALKYVLPGSERLP